MLMKDAQSNGLHRLRLCLPCRQSLPCFGDYHRREVPSVICDLYFHSSTHDGVQDMTARVGACKTADCSCHKDFECTADSIHVGMKAEEPDCLTFRQS